MVYQQLVNMEYRPDHEIPFSREEIITMLLDEGQLNREDINSFKNLCRILNSIYHFEFHDQLEDLKHSYKYYNPDLQDVEYNEESNRKMLPEWINTISMLLTEANYNIVSEQDIERSLVKESVFPVSAEINLKQFEIYKIFYQGQSKGKTKIKSRVPFLKKDIEFEFYNRVVLLFKVKELSELSSKNKIRSALKPGKIYLKYFRNIPKLDLEMIFPDPKPKMNGIDKLKIWVPLISGIGILLKEFFYDPFISKVSASPFTDGLSITVLSILFALFGYAYTTYDSYKFSIMSLLSEIAQSLYFKDIGNNEAVLTALVDAAEEEEGKEVILAYYFLLNSPYGLTAAQLDEKIEGWMDETHNTKIDFEVSDGLKKLETLNILRSGDGENYSVPNLDDTLKKLDLIWDNYFQYSNIR